MNFLSDNTKKDTYNKQFDNNDTRLSDGAKNSIADSSISKNNPFLKKDTNTLDQNEENANHVQDIPVSSQQIKKSPPRRIKKVPIPQMPIKNGRKGRLSVNLVPEDTLRIVKKDLPDRLKFLVLFVILLFALLLFGWGILSWLQITTFQNMQTLKNSITEKEIQIHTYKTQSSEIVKLRQRYDLIKVLLSQHVYWTKFFALLEKYTIDDVYYTSFSVKSDENARITFNARGRNVQAIAKQLKVLQDADDFIADVKINGFSMLSGSERRSQNISDTEIVSFDIIVTLDPNVFLLTADNQN